MSTSGEAPVTEAESDGGYSQDIAAVEQEAEGHLENLMEHQGKTLRDLQKESLRIEENVLIAQKRVQFQRLQLQKKLEEATEAKQLEERLLIQRRSLLDRQSDEDTERVTRKGFKNTILELFDHIKLKTTEVKHLLESRNRSNQLKTLVLVKRENFIEVAKNLEEKEKQERVELQESHERAAKNLLVWQELQVRHVSGERKEALARVNRLRAQQLREMQRKEAEQLRELQHMKAKFKLQEFDNDLEFTSSFEKRKADHLALLNSKALEQKKDRRNAKRDILRLREEAKKANSLEVNQLKARQLKAIEENRAKELKDFQKREAKRSEIQFEQEIEAMDVEMKELLSSDAFDLSTFASRSSGGTGGRSSEARQSTGASSNKSMTSEGEQSMKSDVTDKTDSSHHTTESEERMLEEDEKEMEKKVNLIKENAAKALVTAEQRMKSIESMHEDSIRKQLNTDEAETKRMQEEYEERRGATRKSNELEIMDLLKLHAKEKLDIQSAHQREMESLEKSLELETQLHKKSLHKSQVASQAKSEFLSFVCHELRNPLSAIVAVVDMLLSNSLLDNDTQEHIATVKQESELMCAIVNDVLDFAKIEARMLVLEPTDFNVHLLTLDLVREQQLSAKKTRPKIVLEHDIDSNVPELINTDPIRIRQVLLNLVSNAVKFTFDGTITVKLSVEKRIDDKSLLIQFSVRDTGVGIAETDLEHIFAAFSQAKPSITREFGGTGLGLSISKSLVERLGGKITVESEKNVGTCFTFSVTARVVSQQQFKKAEEKKVAKDEGTFFPQGLDVLIVEDSATLRRLWSKLLLEQGCVVQTAGNGQEALDKCADNKFDVVLMDITMPVMSGDVAVKKLRERDWSDVVIALTANAMESDREKYLQAGMDAVLTKPCKMDNLKAVVVDQLRKRNSPKVA